MKEARVKLKEIRDRIVIIAALCGSIADLARTVESADLANSIEVLAETACEAAESASRDAGDALLSLAA